MVGGSVLRTSISSVPMLDAVMYMFTRIGTPSLSEGRTQGANTKLQALRRDSLTFERSLLWPTSVTYLEKKIDNKSAYT